MGQRFGGEFSPQGKSAVPGKGTPPPAQLKSPLRGQARTTILMALAVIPVFASFFSDGALGLAGGIAAGAAIFSGALLTREGLKAEAAWAERRIARRPAIPRKIFGAIVVGVGVMLAAGIGPAGAIYGLVAAALHIASFGLDPMSDKGMEGIDAFQTERVARSIEEAEKHLSAMNDAVLRARDREALTRVEALSGKARAMFRTVEDDPRDLSSARKFLGVYLMGARDATVKFADLYAANRDPAVKADYFKLIDDLERGFDAKRETLLVSDRTDLDVEIEVLRDRLKADGLSTGE
ncbi:5-bromo-4-chloroindolyl phosphate hydrolysis protein [Jannaschia faecimaris]|uniref:5-bromo-4-chloroindolyl phosphate hydrolysis protein n=1 Tax=Jannaschia faecimaris TaxID=1244108 RepID=A0A1H3Q9P0_9RHOB|nr:5-bromo-4-chloroindolyl phosphate hydrolysis family protein [Jannaschia faecimaris]SDZ10254.1 5-bromo-4-chloroindolyl phosphate hydrolysis protein [Jannaschia faecimaris]